MKRLYSFVAVFLCSLASWAQVDPATNPDGYVKRLMERYTVAPTGCEGCESTGIVLVQVAKSGDRLKTDFLFNSFTQKQVLTEAALNQASNLEQIKAIPDGFQITIPVFIYLGNDDGKFSEPDAATKKRYEEVLASLNKQQKISSPVIVIGYKPQRKTGTGK